MPYHSTWKWMKIKGFITKNHENLSLKNSWNTRILARCSSRPCNNTRSCPGCHPPAPENDWKLKVLWWHGDITKAKKHQKTHSSGYPPFMQELLSEWGHFKHIFESYVCIEHNARFTRGENCFPLYLFVLIVHDWVLKKSEKIGHYWVP